MPEWDAEIEVDEERARQLIGAEFPELHAAPLRRIAEGWDNVVFLLDERWVFRFPRRQIAVAGVEREIDTLPKLVTHLPLAVPNPHWIGRPRDGYPWPWFGAAHLPGVELAEAGLPDGDRVKLGAALGTFLRELHAPGIAARMGSGLPVDPGRRADMRRRVPLTREWLAALARAGVVVPDPELERLLRDAEGLPAAVGTVVVHGDLHVRHLLVEEGRATGVIDWGDVAVADPSVDLGIAYAAFAGPAREALLEAYGRVAGLTELRARVVGAWLSVALLTYAVDLGSPRLRAETLRSLQRVVA